MGRLTIIHISVVVVRFGRSKRFYDLEFEKEAIYDGCRTEISSWRVLNFMCYQIVFGLASVVLWTLFLFMNITLQIFWLEAKRQKGQK